MPEQNSNQQQEDLQLEAITAIDFAERATKIFNDMENWENAKKSMKDWLKDNVGSKIDGTFETLDDQILISSRDTAYAAVDYLKDCKRHLYQLSQNPNQPLTVHNKPPRDEDNLANVSVAKIIDQWDDPMASSAEPTPSNDNNSGTGE